MVTIVLQVLGWLVFLAGTIGHADRHADQGHHPRLVRCQLLLQPAQEGPAAVEEDGGGEGEEDQIIAGKADRLL